MSSPYGLLSVGDWSRRRRADSRSSSYRPLSFSIRRRRSSTRRVLGAPKPNGRCKWSPKRAFGARRTPTTPDTT